MSSNLLGSIYFIHAVSVKRIKIGWTEDLWTRLYALRLGSPVSLTPLGFIPGTMREEAALHEVFKEHRLHGEWFKAHVYLRDFIRETARPWPEERPRAPRGIFRLATEGWLSEHDVRCQVCAQVIPSQSRGYRYNSYSGIELDLCERCSRTKQGDTRRFLRLGSPATS